MIFLSSSCTHNATKILGRWESADAETNIRAKSLSFNARHGMYWRVTEKDSIRYRYDVEDQRLLTMNRYGLFNYEILKLNKKTLILRNEADPTQLLNFKLVERFTAPISQKNSLHKPMERDIYSLIYALTGPNVEVRLKNLIAEFQEGDYVTTETLYYLTGVKQHPEKGELADTKEHRRVIAKIKKIERVGEQFRVSLENDEDIFAELPFYTNKDGKREIERVLDLRIKQDAVINISYDERHVKIDIDGIRVGKGWLKVGVPTLTISGNYGSLLGFKFKLNR